jgi:hypothetical protein
VRTPGSVRLDVEGIPRVVDPKGWLTLATGEVVERKSDGEIRR